MRSPWRVVADCAGLVYAAGMAILLSRGVSEARAIVAALDGGRLPRAPPQRSYGEACELTAANLAGAAGDVFVALHLFGWAANQLVLRDAGLSLALAFSFELLEITFEHVQPNFVECWWDRWVLDMACNTLGVCLGQLLLRLCSARDFDWLGRAHAPFPQWRALQEPWRLLQVLAFCTCYQLVHLNAFFLKDILWLPTASRINLYHIFIWFFLGLGCCRDYYAVISGAARRVGCTGWLAFLVFLLELLIVVKFWPELGKGRSMPAIAVAAWAAAAAVAVPMLAWLFAYRRRI